MNSTPVSSILLIFACSVVGSFGAVFLKSGATRTLNGGVLAFLNRHLLFGVSLYLGSSVLYGAGVRHGQLSVLYPMVSLGYVWTVVWSRIFFQEQFTRQKMAGLGLVLLGVFLVGMGS